MSVLIAYLDDSGTHGEAARAVVWGGFVGTVQQWAAFEPPWRALLDEPLPGKPRLKKYSNSKCRAQQGEFVGYSRDEAEETQRRFRQVAVDAGLQPLAYVIDVKEWDALVTGAARDYYGSAAQVSFGACMLGALNAAAEMDLRYVNLIFDRGQKTATLDAIIDKGISSRHVFTGTETTAVSILHTGWSVVEDVLPLQAADIIANETYAMAAKEFTTGRRAARPQFHEFLSQMTGRGYVLDRPAIIQTLKMAGFSVPDEERSS